MAVELSQTIGDRDVLTTGVLVMGTADAMVGLKLGESLSFSIQFEERADGANRADFSIEGGHMTVRLPNTSAPLGIAYDIGLIGEYKGRGLYLSLFINSVGTEAIVRVLTYTFSVGADV